jgi:hypothetical protein
MTSTGHPWGLCPKCHAEPASLANLGKHHYATCAACGVAWYVGYNLMTTPQRWEDEDLVAVFGHANRERLRREELAYLENNFRLVERPYFPGGDPGGALQVPLH